VTFRVPPGRWPCRLSPRRAAPLGLRESQKQERTLSSSAIFRSDIRIESSLKTSLFRSGLKVDSESLFKTDGGYPSPKNAGVLVALEAAASNPCE